jgi:hypothetical protein
MSIVAYTEDELKRAFELGVTWAAEGGALGKKPDFNTPEDVHKINMSLFVWRVISWKEALQWILKLGSNKPRPNVMNFNPRQKCAKQA